MRDVGAEEREEKKKGDLWVIVDECLGILDAEGMRQQSPGGPERSLGERELLISSLKGQGFQGESESLFPG